MHCDKARLRLKEIEKEGGSIKNDPQLAEHLKGCQECAKIANSAMLLEDALLQASHNDEEKILPISMMKTRIEKIARQTSGNSIFSRKYRKRPVIAFGIVTILIFITIITVIPFKYDQTIGYEVALDGIETDLAENEELICDVLSRLELWDADYDSLQCDTTCSLHIVYLKSHREVQMVVSAFSSFSEEDVTAEIIPVRTTRRGNLLDRVI